MTALPSWTSATDGALRNTWKRQLEKQGRVLQVRLEKDGGRRHKTETDGDKKFIH